MHDPATAPRRHLPVTRPGQGCRCAHNLFAMCAVRPYVATVSRAYLRSHTTAHPSWYAAYMLKGISRMSPTNAFATGAGLLAGLSIPLTIELEIPAWMVFLAWATYFFCGQGVEALRAQLATNSWGVVLGAAAFLVIVHFELTTWPAAAVVGIAAFGVAQSGRIPIFSAGPGLFVGFAMIAAAVQVAGVPITEWGAKNPLVLALETVLLGSAFAVATEWIARGLSRNYQNEATPDLTSEH